MPSPHAQATLPTWRYWVTGCMAVVMLSLTEARAQSSGLITRASRFSVKETLQRIEEVATARGLTIFARIDHAGEASRAGQAMRPTQLLVLGNPKGGTPVMQAAPSAAIDLPLKVLVAERADGTTEVTINDSRWLADRHGVPSDLVKNVSALPGLLDAALQ